MRAAHPALRTSALALVAAAMSLLLSACSSSRGEYEKAAKSLQPTFDEIRKIREETLLDPNIPPGGDFGVIIHDQIDRCNALGEKVSKVSVATGDYTDKALVGMIAGVKRSLEDRAHEPACKLAAEPSSDDPAATMRNWKACVDACRGWFANVERDAAIFTSNARSAGIEMRGLPSDDRFR